MEYALLGRTGLSVSRLCLGTMMFGGQTNEADSIAIVNRALEAGINFIDTADVYNNGESERVTGVALKGKRDGVVLATKFVNPMGPGRNDKGASRYHLIRATEASLKRLGTDRIDIQYIHKPDEATPLDETLRALEDLVRQGKIRYVACSNFRAWQVMDGLAISAQLGLASYACIQPLYNIVNRDAEVELLPLCAAKQVGVVSYSPLARGILTGKYKAGGPPPAGSRAARGDKRMQEAELREESFVIAEQLAAHAKKRGIPLSHFALAWVLANRIITSAIVGPRTMEQFEDNLGAIGVKLNAEDEAAVDALVPKGEHSGKGFRDPQYPIVGRKV